MEEEKIVDDLSVQQLGINVIRRNSSFAARQIAEKAEIVKRRKLEGKPWSKQENNFAICRETCLYE